MNKTVLITGAAVRLGRTIAETLARRGWDVVVHAHRSADAADDLVRRLRASGGRAWRIPGDLLEPEGPDAVFDAARAAAGRLDALVNNAALFERLPLTEATPADFERLWRVNALAPIRLAQRLAAHAAEGSSAAVVNLLDQRIARADPLNAQPYGLSKKTLEAFTLSAALALAPRVRVNAVAPGAVLVPTAAGEPAGAFPLGQRPTPAHVADAVAYLLDADAVTGQILFVDGGQHLTS